MRALSIFAWIITALGLILLIIVTLAAWVEFLGGTAGVLVGVFLMPFAVLAMPIIAGILLHSAGATMTGYTIMSIIWGFAMLANWAGKKADEAQTEREAFRLWLRTRQEPNFTELENSKE